MTSLTNVPVERQKVMMPGGILKDEWTPFQSKIKPGMKIMVMGTADEVVVTAPTVDVKFIEDLPTEDQNAGSIYPAGLLNTGNTCYLNSSVQFLRAAPELVKAVEAYRGGDDPNSQAISALKIVCEELETSSSSVLPMGLTLIMRDLYPQFAEERGGMHMQQDAEEFYNAMLNVLRNVPAVQGSGPGRNIIDQLFSGDFSRTTKCLESDQESETTETVSFQKLSCHITNAATSGNSQSINFLTDGLDVGLSETLEKHSNSLNRNAQYRRVDRISRLPYYLTIHFVRFFWKKDTEKKAKILRPVSFPMVLDVLPYCTDDLKEKLKRNRDSSSESLATGSIQPYENRTGRYALYAIVTHQGRSADGGHYVAFVRQSRSENDWLEFNDDKVIPRTKEDIINLDGKGGGDWHIAYLCLYRTID